MLEKWKKILKSTRFQSAIVICVVMSLYQFQIIPPELAQPILALFGISITVRTADSVAERLNGKRLK